MSRTTIFTFKQFITEMPKIIYMDKDAYGIKRKDETYVSDKSHKLMGKTASGHSVIKVNHPGYAGTKYMAIDDNNTIHMQVFGKHKGNALHIDLLKGHHKSTIKAHEFYRHLLNHFDLVSDSSMSEGGSKTWEHLSKYKDVQVSTKHRDQLVIPNVTWNKNFGDETRFHATKRT